MSNPAVKIDPSLVPAADYDLACTVLAASIRAVLADPKLRKEYEDWKAKNAAKSTRREVKS